MTAPLIELSDQELALEDAVRVVEAILFVSGRPVTIQELAGAAEISEDLARAALDRVEAIYAERGVHLQAVAGGYQFGTRPEQAPAIARFLGSAGREPLSHAALEVLAIVAYRQPVTRAEVEAVRGVRCDYVLERLEERRLIRVVGRKTAPGRPMMFGTTEAFLRYFGLADLSALPPAGQTLSAASLAGAKQAE
jgi:segregation and condensation protein B